MDHLRLKCDGVVDGPLSIPAFELRQGQAICLQIPYPTGVDVDLRLYHLLMGLRTHPALRINGPIRWVDGTLSLPRRRSWLDSFFHKISPSPRAVDWLRKNGSMSHDQATAIVGRLGFSPSWRCNRFPGTPKTLIGLEAAWASGAEAVVLSMAGLDPLGRQAVIAAVAEHLYNCPAIYLAYPCWHQWQLFQDAVPGVTCLPLGYRGSNVKLPVLEETLSNRAS